jgi:hypothetical protein
LPRQLAGFALVFRACRGHPSTDLTDPASCVITQYPELLGDVLNVDSKPLAGMSWILAPPGHVVLVAYSDSGAQAAIRSPNFRFRRIRIRSTPASSSATKVFLSARACVTRRHECAGAHF